MLIFFIATIELEIDLAEHREFWTTCSSCHFHREAYMLI